MFLLEAEWKRLQEGCKSFFVLFLYRGNCQISFLTCETKIYIFLLLSMKVLIPARIKCLLTVQFYRIIKATALLGGLLKM